MRRWNLILAALPLTALAIAGCGGGDGDDSTTAPAVATTPTTTALSKEELIARGDAICAEVNAAIGALAASETDAESQTAQTASLYIGMVQSLKGLGTPEDASGFSEFNATADELSAVENELQLAVEREDSAAIGAAATSAAPALEGFQSAAGAYGFESCSEGPSAPTAPATTEAPSPESAPEEEPEAAPEVEPEAAPEPAPETGGASGAAEEGAGGGTAGGTEGGGGTTGGDSGGIGPG